MRTVFPSVWSSFCTMNVPALETFVSRVKVSFRTPSGSTNFSAREGWFMVPRRFARAECWGQTLCAAKCDRGRSTALIEEFGSSGFAGARAASSLGRK
jgi:hypothetical protein